jgi:Protein of unknown function (DUF2933)
MTLIFATGFPGLFALLFVLACPLMMILMMRGMHGGGQHSPTETKSRERMSLDELKHARDELNEEISERASR